MRSKLTVLFCTVIFVFWLRPAASAQSFEPFEIPLYLFNIGTTSAPSYKAGIRLQVDSVNEGGPVWRMYEFDTGGTGFFAFPYAASSSSTGNYAINYASGNALTGNAVHTTITFETMSGSAGAQVTTNMVQITSASSPTPSNSLNSWTTLLPDTPPLEVFFYGDFGMGLGGAQPTAPSPGDPTMYAIIPQLVGPENNGFVIKLGNVPDPNAAPGAYGEIGMGSIQVGLTLAQADVSSWESAVSMTPPSGDQFPNSLQPVYSEILSNGTMSVGDLGPLAVGIVYDTGAPNTKVHPVGSGSGMEEEIEEALDETGAPFTLIGDPAAGALGSEILDYSLGSDSGVNEASISLQNAINSPGLYVNTGITAFFGREVVFNLQDGFVGFQTVPEPSTYVLLGLGMGTLLVAGKLRNRRLG